MAEENKNQAARPGEEKPKNQDEQIKALRTFESDVLEALKRQKTSTVDIVTAEQIRPKEEVEETILPPVEPEHPGRSRLLLTISGIFVVAGIIAGGAYWFLQPKKPPAAPVTAAGQTIIAIDLIKTIDFTNLTHKQSVEAVQKERDAATLRVGATEAVTFTERTEDESIRELSAEEFISRIAPSIPPSLGRALDKEFVFGLIGYDGNQPFLILRTKEFETAFDGLLQGEIDLYREAGSIFVPGKGPLPRLSTSSLAYFGTDPNTQVFRDKVVRNLDTRVVVNSANKVIFLYAFADQATIVITTNEKTFTEIIEKLKRARLIN